MIFLKQQKKKKKFCCQQHDVTSVNVIRKRYRQHIVGTPTSDKVAGRVNADLAANKLQCVAKFMLIVKSLARLGTLSCKCIVN